MGGGGAERGGKVSLDAYELAGAGHTENKLHKMLRVILFMICTRICAPHFKQQPKRDLRHVAVAVAVVAAAACCRATCHCQIQPLLRLRRRQAQLAAVASSSQLATTMVPACGQWWLLPLAPSMGNAGDDVTDDMETELLWCC